MPQAQNQIIRPAAPEPLLAGLLALTEARLLSLEGAYETDLPDGSRELIAGVRGAPVLRFSQAEAEIPAGGLALLSQPGSCRLTATGDCQCAILRLTGTLPEQLLSPEDACVIYPQGAAAVRETVTTLAVLNREGSGIDAPTASAHAYSLLMKLLRLRDAGAPSHYSALIDAAVGIINEDFAYLEGLDDLAERLEVSKPHLIRTFTREVGVSPGKYITRARIEYAKLLLSEPDMSIAFAAEATGFAGANYFAKVFRRETGLSPTEFQQSVPQARRRPAILRDEDRLYMP